MPFYRALPIHLKALGVVLVVGKLPQQRSLPPFDAILISILRCRTVLCYSGREARFGIRYVNLVSYRFIPFPFAWTRVFRVPFRSATHAIPITREGAGKDLLEEEEQAAQKRWESLSTREKISDWALKHQYPLILGSWAASMGVAAAIIMKDRHQTTSQKVCKGICVSRPLDRFLLLRRLFKLVCGHRG